MDLVAKQEKMRKRMRKQTQPRISPVTGKPFRVWRRLANEERRQREAEKILRVAKRIAKREAKEQAKRQRDELRRCIQCLKYGSYSYPVGPNSEYCSMHNPKTPRCEGPPNKEYAQRYQLTHCRIRVRPPNRFCSHHRPKLGS